MHSDHCDNCGRAVVEDMDDPLSYGYAADGALLCYPCLDAELVA